MARVPAGIKRAELDELLDLDEQIKALEVRRDVLKDKVKRVFGDITGTRVHGVVVLDFGVQNRFDPAAFAEVYPSEKRPEFYALAVNAKAIPKELKAGFVTPTRQLSISRAA